jgi:hypothetical protein
MSIDVTMEGESNFISQSSTLYGLSSIFLTGTLQSKFSSVPEGDKVYSKPTQLSKVLTGLNTILFDSLSNIK